MKKQRCCRRIASDPEAFWRHLTSFHELPDDMADVVMAASTAGWSIVFGVDLERPTRYEVVAIMGPLDGQKVTYFEP
jgi:hypothetical protein